MLPLNHKSLLYLICLLADFCGFVVVFVVSRQLAEEKMPDWYLGMAGAAFALSSGVANIVGGVISHRFSERAVFLFGIFAVPLAIVLCAFAEPHDPRFLLRYCLLGLGLGSIYPTLIGWLNRDQDAHANRRGVSRTLILFCISWNVGMLCGQMTSGALFSVGRQWVYAAGLLAALANVGLALVVVRRIARRSEMAVGPADMKERRSAVVPEPELLLASRCRYLSWIANAGGTFGGSLVFHLLPSLMVTIGVSADQHGTLLAWWRGVVIVTYLLMHWSHFWHFRMSASVVSQLLGVAGLLSIAFAPSATMVLIGLTLHGQLAGFNYFSGLFYSTAGSAREKRTLAAGIHEATLAAGMACGTVLGGFLGSRVNERAPWLMAAGVLLVLMTIQVVAWQRWYGMSRTKAAPARS